MRIFRFIPALVLTTLCLTCGLSPALAQLATPATGLGDAVRATDSGGGGGAFAGTADYLVAGEDGVADAADPRDGDGLGDYDDPIACNATFGACLFQSSTGNVWTYDQTNTEWTCATCQRFVVQPLSRYWDGSATTNCFDLNANFWTLSSTSQTCDRTDTNVYLGGFSGGQLTLERLDITAARSWTGTQGCTVTLSDDEAATDLATFAFPGGGETALEGETVAATGIPVQVGDRLSMAASTASGNCEDNDGTCACPGTRAAWIRVEVMEL